MDVRELITLQIGHYSNFIGSHWWNIQEAGFCYDKSTQSDINHDYLFREGRLTSNQESYTPRLLVVDAKGSLGTMPTSGTLYDPLNASPSTCHAMWSDQIDLIHQLPLEKNEFLQALDEEDEIFNMVFDEDKDICSTDSPEVKTPLISKKIFNISSKVKVWSDFLRVHYHPKTVVLLKNIEHHDGLGNSGFQSGAGVMRREDVEEEIADRIRMLAEGCGSLQGFNLLSDVHNEMGGVAWQIGEHLADEYGRKDVISVLSTSPHLKPETAQERNLFLSSVLQSYNELSKVSSLVIPLNFRKHSWHSWVDGVSWNHLKPNLQNMYESSSILASFLDTATMTMRTKVNPLPMSALSQLLNIMNRKFVSGSVSLPLGVNNQSSLFDYLNTLPQENCMNLVSLSCNSDIKSNLAEALTLRGISNDRIVSPKVTLPFNVRITSVEQMLDHYTTETLPSSVDRHVKCVSDPLKTSAPYPLIFKKGVNPEGFIVADALNDEYHVKQIPVASGLHQGSGMARVLESILKDGERLNVTKIPKLIDEEITKETWKETLESFKNVVKCFEI